MTTPADLRRVLCSAFCDGLWVGEVPAGLAVSTGLVGHDGDEMLFYLIDGPDGPIFEDDGDFIADALAGGLVLDAGGRGRMLDIILAEQHAYLDRDTCQIRSLPLDERPLGNAAIQFMHGLIRARDMLLVSTEMVASTFAEDLREKLRSALPESIEVEGAETDVDNPADLVLRDRRKGLKAALVYAVSNDLKLVEAQLRHSERHRGDAPVIAVIEKPPGQGVSLRRFARAQNKGLRMPIFTGSWQETTEGVLASLPESSAA